jgi:TRAP-type uncharacterized transport system substrate-binding protein
MRYDESIITTYGEEGNYITRTCIQLAAGAFVKAALEGETYERSGERYTHLDNLYCHVDLKALTITASGPLQDETIRSFVKTVYDRAQELQRLHDNIKLISDALPSRKESHNEHNQT